MKKIVENALDFIEGVDYGEIRLTNKLHENITVRKGKLETLTKSEDIGVGVRVLINGYWGFSGTNDISIESIAKAIAEAKKLAKASSLAGGKKIELAPEPAYKDIYVTPHEIDPFEISLDEKIDYLFKIDRVLRESKFVVNTEANLHFTRTYQIFASTEGSFIEQTIIESGGGIMVYTFKDGILARRSYPGSHGGNTHRAGYEFIKELNLLGHAPKVVEEAQALLYAPKAPSGEMDLVIHNSQLFLQIHESIGHALELDRVLGWEASYAGESFATLEKLNKFRYGSPLLNITSDSTVKGGLGTYGYDDEGVKAQRTWLIKEGILVGYLMSRDTASQLGLRSNGAARASDWSRIPIVRMTNVNLEPGDKKLEELIDGVKEGLFIMTNKSWSIDQRRLNFQFSTEIGWKIKNGKLTEMVRDPVYTGITPEFWSKMDAVGNDWVLWGVINCGKGEPPQSMHVGHGTPSARFRKVKLL